MIARLVLIACLLSACERAVPERQPAREAEVDRDTGAEAPRDTQGEAPRDTAITRDPSPALPAIAVLTAVRHGVYRDANNAYDRIVFQFAGKLPAYKVEYIDRPVRQCGSGDVVPLPGDAWLSIRFEPANAHDEQGRASVEQRDVVVNGRVLLRLKLICDFEAIVEWIAAVSTPGKFKLLELTDPTRLVVDIRQ